MLFLALIIIEIIIIFFLSRSLTQNLARFFYSRTRDRKRTVYLLALLFLPGTFLHEISHFLFALFLLVPVDNIELMPEIDESGTGVKMGSVPIGSTDPLRRVLIGIAPFLLGLAVILGGFFYLYSHASFLRTYPIVLVPIVYCLFTFSNTMFSSPKDLEGTLELIAVIGVLSLVAYFLGLRFPDISIPPAWISQINYYLKNSTLFLSIPIFLDLVILALIKFLHR